MQKTTVTLIIPALNEAAVIERCLAAALAQTRPFDEIIVIDNGSHDETATLAARFTGVRVIHEAKRGIAYARNAGAAAATSQWLARIDADTVLEPHWLETMLSYVVSQKLDGASSYVASWDSRTRYLVPLVFSWLFFHWHQLVGGGAYLFGSSSLFKRSLWQRLAPILSVNNDHWEDLDLTISAHKAGAQIGFVRQQLAAVSSRRARLPAAEIWPYLMACPRTYLYHGQRLAGLLSYNVVLYGTLAAIVWHPLAPVTRSDLSTADYH